jgi:hypothetical protein
MNAKTTISIGGQSVGLRFAYPCWKYFSQASLKNKDSYFLPPDKDGNVDFTVDGMGKLLHCGYLNDCLVKEIDPVLTNEAFCDWVEDQRGTDEGQAELIRVIKVYAESSEIKQQIAATEQEKKSQEVTEASPVTDPQTEAPQ